MVRSKRLTLPPSLPPSLPPCPQASQVLDFLTANGFNGIRLPFSLAMALDLGRKNDQWLEDEDLRGLTGGELLEK